VAEPRRLSFDPIAEAERQWGVHEWPDQAPGMAVVTSIMRLQQIFLSRADTVLRPLGLTFARYEVLMLLSFSREGALPLGKIGERLQVNAASVTNAVDRLQSDGLVTRRSNPDDGRGRLACLTAAGRHRAAVATDAMNEQVFTDLGVPPSTVRRLFDLLAELRRAAGDFE
jgi:DNA-binding MarR family transcriptional regulator